LDNPDYEEWTERNISHTYVHPQFDNYAAYYDVAILQLVQPIQYSERIRPICLPQQNHSMTPDGKLLRVIGWGLTDNNVQTSLLRSTYLELFSSR
jgi:hypothetical protein